MLNRTLHCDAFAMCAVLLGPVQYSPLLCCSMIRISEAKFMPKKKSIKILVGLENCAFIGYYATCSGTYLPTFRDNLSVSFSKDNPPVPSSREVNDL